MTGKKTGRERLQERYPDRQWGSDDEMLNQMANDYDSREEEVSTLRDREKQLTDMFSKNPKAARFMADMANGKDPWVSMLEMQGADSITEIMNDPAKKEEYAKANQAYLDRVAKDGELEKEYNANLEASLTALDKMQQERGLSDEMIDEAVKLIATITDEFIMGKFTPETIDIALKAISHDADVSNAREEGGIAERNRKIDEKLRKPSGDGMPKMGGSNNAQQSQRKPKGIFDLVAGM